MRPVNRPEMLFVAQIGMSVFGCTAFLLVTRESRRLQVYGTICGLIANPFWWMMVVATDKFPPGGNPSHHTRDGRVNRPRLQREGDTRRVRTYEPPAKANPGNVIECHGGGGHMGSRLAHENEAPFPEKLAEAFVLSFCPPEGMVLDCFCGSGTTLAVAVKHGRQAIGIDVRQSQVELSRRRLQLA